MKFDQSAKFVVDFFEFRQQICSRYFPLIVLVYKPSIVLVYKQWVLSQ